MPLGLAGSGALGLFSLGYGAIRCLGNGLLLRFNSAVAADATALGVRNFARAPEQQK